MRNPEQPLEVLLPFPTPLADATAFRSTWLASSLSALRELGHMDRYLRELPARHHDAVMFSVAGVWIPIEVAMEHYAACERLNLDRADIAHVGRSVTNRVHGTALATVVRLAKQSGVTPWHAMMQLNRFWERVWYGGGVRVSKVGEKDALIELGGWPVAEFAYVHAAMPPVTEAILELFCRRVFARDVPERGLHHTVAVHVSWV